MRADRIARTIVILGLLPAGLGQSCPPSTSTLSEVAPPTLSDLELAAVDGAIDAGGALAQAAAMSQSGPAAVDDNTAQLLPSLPDSFSFGTCPLATLTRTTIGGLGFDLTVDFGQGCSPVFAAGDVQCAGRASGSLDVPTRTLELAFQAIACDDEALSGNASLTYSASLPSVSMAGEWDLTLTDLDNQSSLITAGSGTSVYDADLQTVNVSSFSGMLSEGGVVSSMIVDDILVSYAAHGSYVPFGGSITIAGSQIRTLIVVFNESSPTTGQVDVSVDGGPTLTVNLLDL